MTTSTDANRPRPTLQERVATRVREEMAGARKTNKELAELLHVSPRAAMRRRLGEVEFSLNELDLVAGWLGLTPYELVRTRRLELAS